jgi:hypothetical protein
MNCAEVTVTHIQTGVAETSDLRDLCYSYFYVMAVVNPILYNIRMYCSFLVCFPSTTGYFNTKNLVAEQLQLSCPTV